MFELFAPTQRVSSTKSSFGGSHMFWFVHSTEAPFQGLALVVVVVPIAYQRLFLPGGSVGLLQGSGGGGFGVGVKVGVGVGGGGALVGVGVGVAVGVGVFVRFDVGVAVGDAV